MSKSIKKTRLFIVEDNDLTRTNGQGHVDESPVLRCSR